MRFEQLKHSSNTIVRKKLYKSGKNWVVMSTLAFIGGIVLLGATSVSTVKADDISDTNTEQQQVNANTAKMKNRSSVDSGDEITGDGTTGDTEEHNQDIIDDNSIPQQSGKDSGTNELRDDVGGNSSAEPQQIYETTTATNGSITGTSSTDKNTASTTNSNDVDSGEGWRIDSNHTLHFTSSNTELIGDSNNGWQADQYHSGPNAITSITFDNNVTAGSNLSELFVGLTAVKSVSGFDKLDTSHTTNFSNMFAGCTDLQTVDIAGLDTSAGTNFSDMFVSCSKLQSVDISKWDLSNGTNFIAMFAGCTSLKSLDLSNWDMSKLGPSNYGALLGGTSLESLKLGPKDKLDSSIGLEDPEISNDTIKTGWTSIDYETADNPNGFYNSETLEGTETKPGLYDGINGKKTTWQTYPKFVNFKVQYIDDTDPNNPITYSDPNTY